MFEGAVCGVVASVWQTVSLANYVCLVHAEDSQGDVHNEYQRVAHQPSKHDWIYKFSDHSDYQLSRQHHVDSVAPGCCSVL